MSFPQPGRATVSVRPSEIGATADARARADILEQFATTGDIRGLIVAIVLSDNFRFLNTAGDE